MGRLLQTPQDLNLEGTGSDAMVLVIEPDPRQAIGLVRALSSLARVRLASGMADALAASTTEVPQLLLVSDNLPEAKLPAVIRACRLSDSLAHVPVAAMLSHADETAEVAALQAGAVACVPRHASATLIASRLRSTLSMLRNTAYWRATAQSDSLTGLASRRQLDSVLDREWRRAQRLQRPLALLMVDLDHFKAYNARHGHLGGDECLRAVAEVLRQGMRRPTDVVGRYGGEEFAVLLSETDGHGGRVMADLLHNAVGERALPHGGDGAGPRVSVSIGVSAWEPGQADTGVCALVAAADAALYEAKRQGRDGSAWRSLPAGGSTRLSERRMMATPPLFPALAAPLAWSH